MAKLTYTILLSLSLLLVANCGDLDPNATSYEAEMDTSYQENASTFEGESTLDVGRTAPSLVNRLAFRIALD